MKTITMLLVSFLFALSAIAGTIRVKVNGNQQIQVVVDGTTYNSDNFVSGEMAFSNLAEGKHTVVIYRTNNRGVSKQIYSSTIMLDANKEILLTVGSGGSISREEFTSNEAYGMRTPMNESSYNQLYIDVRNRWGQSAKLSAARDAFNTAANYFTTYQISRVIQLINSEAGRLELAKLAYDNVTDPANFSQISSLLNSQASKNELQDYINNFDEDTGTASKTAMTTARFTQIYNNVNSKRGTAKMTAARNALNSSADYFTVDQVRQLITLLTSENQRLQLAKLSLDNIVDMENVEQLFSLLANQSSKDDLDLYIRNNGYADMDYTYTSRTAMSDASYNSLFESIRKKWLPGSKFNAAMDAFNSTTNYFTTAQAKQIISLLSSESNRLQLAKLAFDNIVDPLNFRNMYDIFSDAAQDELDVYIKPYGY
jgi:CTP:phosphocholine cytidylyltransferase-like protein